ncbi:MAG: response regulator [Pseudomonadota bacterium]
MPSGEKVANSIAQLIDLEAQEPATESRKALLKNMADMLGSLGLSMSAVRAYLISGDPSFREEFQKYWMTNDSAFRLLRKKIDLLTDEQLAIYKQMALSRTVLEADTREVTNLRNRKEWNIAQDMVAQQVVPLLEELKTAFHKLLESHQTELINGSNVMHEHAKREVLQVWLRFFPVFFFIASLLLFIRHLIMRQVGGEPRAIQQVARRVANGDLSDVDSHGRTLTGVGEAVQQMIESLRTATQASENSAWIKTNRADLNDTLRGEQNLTALGNKVISFLANCVDAQVGTFYLLRDEHGEDVLKLFASHAYFWRKDASNEFKLGEGLIGQAALEGKSMVLTQVPEGYIPIKSGIGEGQPAQLLIMPFFYEDSLEGVIELAKFEPFTDLQLEFLELIVPSLGSSVYTAEAGSRMQELLEQSQAQSEELQSQSEEMQSQSEELRQANEELAEHMTELEQQRNEMRISQRRLADLMNNLPGVVYQINLDSTYRFISDGVKEVFGYQPEEVIGQPHTMNHPDEINIEAKIVDALKNKRSYSFMQHMLTKSGKELWVLNQGRGVRDEETGKVLYTEGCFTDVTELKTIQDALEKSNQYKSEFLANMSHELRTPLNSLLILSQLLAENKQGNLSTQQVTQAETINTSGHDLLNLINDILDLSKIEAGKIDMHFEMLHLQSLSEDVTRNFEHVAENKGLTFEIHQDDNLPAAINTDSQRLNQILNNLLSNAFKFTEQGKISFHIRRAEKLPRSLSSALTPEQTLMFQVQDTGVGIAEDKQDEVFEAFQQADGTISRNFGGTGLGLSIAREMSRLLGGNIELYSRVGEGSTFTLYLPEKPPESASLGEFILPPSAVEPEQPTIIEAPAPNKQLPPTNTVEPPAPTQTPATPGIEIEDERDTIQDKDKTLLIIEDDYDFTQTLRAIAHEQNFKCLIALDGQDGVELAKSYQPDAIILDIGLPKVDGWSVMDQLKNTPSTRHIPIHCISGREDDLTARRMGAIGYLLKPVSMNELVGALDRLEQFISNDAQTLIILSADSDQQERIKAAIDSQGLTIETISTLENAHPRLQQEDYGCLVVDIDFADGQGINLLESIQNHEVLAEIPVILHAERELSEDENKRLHQLEEKLVVKPVYSPERLLEESTLFLHQIEANLPEEKRQILNLMHNKEALLAGKNILIVDDDMRNFYALASVLEERDMQVTNAKNGEDALQILEEQTFDIILMDIMMPVMDGYEAMRQIRSMKRFQKLPIIALTAKAMKDDKAKCIEAGANDYLPKPIDSHKLLSLMRVWLYR